MDAYYIIAGLGNPGRKYDGSRHNVGFDVIDELVDRHHIVHPVRFGKALIGKGRIGERKVILVKPLTYMNLSGEAVREIVQFYKVDPADHLIVISDDIDLPVGRMRVRMKGSAGGHNGLKNIILHLGSNVFARVRVGVGGKADPRMDLADHVLGHFSREEEKEMELMREKAADAVECILRDGADRAMNIYNTPPRKKEPAKKAPAEKASAEKTPEDKVSAEKAPEEKASAQKAPADKASAEKTAEVMAEAETPDVRMAAGEGTVPPDRE